MGCMSSAEVSNPKKGKGKKQNVKQIQPALYKSKLGKSTSSKIYTPPAAQELPSIENAENNLLPKIRKTTSAQFLTQYEITQTLIESIKMQGPKLITNKITGGVNVLRVYSSDKISEQRLKKFHQILKFELYTDEEQNYLLVDQYCSGPSVCQIFQDLSVQQEQNLSISQRKPKQFQIYQTLLQVYDIIAIFHSKKVYLGNLNLFSFKKLSQFGDQIKLVDFCFEDKNDAQNNGQSNYSSNFDTNKMGHAHRSSFQADWEFYGYLLQFYLSSKSPVFISHKMQYIQSDSLNPYNSLISTLLKGREVSRKQIEQIEYDKIKIKNQNVLMGYKFCNDVIKLVMARKRRIKHNAIYYSQDIFNFYYERNRKQQDDGQSQMQTWRLGNAYNPQQHLLLTQENLHRMETDRILNKIEGYIERLNSECQQHFINYSMTGEKLRKLKEVFLIMDKKQRMDEFKELIPQIK